MDNTPHRPQNDQGTGSDERIPNDGYGNGPNKLFVDTEDAKIKNGSFMVVAGEEFEYGTVPPSPGNVYFKSNGSITRPQADRSQTYPATAGHGVYGSSRPPKGNDILSNAKRLELTGVNIHAIGGNLYKGPTQSYTQSAPAAYPTGARPNDYMQGPHHNPNFPTVPHLADLFRQHAPSQLPSLGIGLAKLRFELFSRI